MPDYFIDQTILQLKLNTRLAIAGATIAEIRYTKPDGTTSGAFPATVQGTFLVHDIETGDIDVEGWWTFQAYVQIAGEDGFGNFVRKFFDTPITP